MDRTSRSSSMTPEASQNNARFFASSSNMGSPDDRSAHRSPDAIEQKQNMDIIKHLLEMFNLDDTMRKYETKNAVEFVLDPNDFGYDCSLSTTRVRQRLCDLMGTDVIRLNDKRYFQKLSQRLQEEYEGVMDKQEESRAAQENERLRRLMLEGIIEAPDDYRAVVHGEDKHKTKKTKKRKSKRRIRITESQEGYGTGQSMTSRSEEDDDGATRKENVRTQVEILDDSQRNRDTPEPREPREASSTPTSILKKKESKANDRSAQQSREILVRPPHHESAGRSSSSCSSYRKARRVKSAAPRLRREKENQSDDSSEDLEDQKYDTVSLPDYNGRHSKYSKHEPESIQRLRMTQTVAGLYSIAEELVSPVRTDDTPDRKVNTSANYTAKSRTENQMHSADNVNRKIYEDSGVIN